jgi:hypothetical protein
MFIDPIWLTEPIHIMVPSDFDDPRTPSAPPPGVVYHYVPPMHPDDAVEVDGIKCTSPSRTLIDMGEAVDEWELREMFARARQLGLLDADELHASRARVEWRPSLEMVDRVIRDFTR